MICMPSNCETPAEQSRELIRESRISTLLTPAKWQELMPGDTVLLIGHDQQRDTGTVYTASADGSFILIMHSMSLIHISETKRLLSNAYAVK
jgi:hypothetical protein